MARLSNAAVIGISESKLDKSITNSEILIDSYDLLRFNWNRNGGGVACYIRNDLSYTQKNLFPNDIENVFFEIHLPKTKSINVGIVYRAPNQTKSSVFHNVRFKQIIKSLTRMTCRNTSLVNHILASIPSRISQHGVINVSVSEHQLTYCTRKINKIKTGCSQTNNVSLD